MTWEERYLEDYRVGGKDCREGWLCRVCTEQALHWALQLGRSSVPLRLNMTRKAPASFSVAVRKGRLQPHSHGLTMILVLELHVTSDLELLAAA